MDKTCSECLVAKPISEFYAHPKMSDGHLGQCKDCVRARIKKNRDENADAVRKYDRDRGKTRVRIAGAVEQTRKWRRANPGANAAHAKVRRALLSGRLSRCSCARCGSEKSNAHHEDYGRPLDVVWLCQPCHKIRHAEMDR